MAKRFLIPAVPKNEAARYTDNPFDSQYYVGLQGYGAGSKDIIVRPNDELLIQKGGSEAFNVYTRLLFDETVQTALVKVTQEITSREWKIEPAADTPGDLAVKEFVEQQLRNLDLDEIYRGMMESYIVGFSVGEVMWRRTASGVVPFDFRFRDQRRFRFQEDSDADYGFTMRLCTREKAFDGEELPARKFVVHRYWAQSNGDPYGAALGRILYPLVKFKRRALESQLLYSDRFSNPTAVAKAPLSATTVEVDTLYDHLSNLSQETALVLPEGFDLEFVNPGGSPETFQNLRQLLCDSIVNLIAGEDEAGQQGAGSNASSEVAQSVRTTRAHDLSELVSATLNNSLVRWIVDLNFGTNVVAPKIYRDFSPKENVDLSMSDVATLVKDVGLRPTVEWITEKFDIDLEEEDKNVPTGPEGTAGVDTANDGGATLDSMDDPEDDDIDEEGDELDTEDVDVDLEDEDEDDDDGDIEIEDDEVAEQDATFRNLLGKLLGEDFAETEDAAQLLALWEGKTVQEANSNE